MLKSWNAWFTVGRSVVWPIVPLRGAAGLASTPSGGALQRLAGASGASAWDAPAYRRKQVSGDGAVTGLRRAAELK